MADSDLVCTTLSATSGVGQAILTWEIVDPNPGRPPYLALAKTEVWVASSNNRALGSKIADVSSNSYTHAGVTPGQTRYYWVRPVNASGVPGEFYPVSATAGVASTAGTVQPGAGSITATELANDAVTNAKIANSAVNTAELADDAVTTAKIGYAQITGAKIGTAEITSAHIVSLAASKISAGTINAVTINGGTISGGYVSGATITGGSIQGVSITTTDFKSSTTNPRVEIGYSVLHVTNVSGTVVLEMIGSTSSPILNIDTSLSSAFVASFRNTSAAAVQGRSPTFAFYASTGGYGPFTGSHTVLWPRSEPLPEPGDLVADGKIMFRNGLSNTISVGKHPVANKPVLGVFVTEAWMNRPAAMGDDVSARDLVALRRDYTMLLVNAVGEGQMNCCDAGGPIEAGDLLVASPIPGKAMKQADDIIRASTVARSREDVIFDSDGRALVAVIYTSG